VIFDDKMQERVILDLSFLNSYRELEVYEDTPFRFKCVDECRKDPRCCKGNVFLVPKDFSTLAKHFNLSKKNFFQRYCNLFYAEPPGTIDGWYNVILKKSENGYCIFLDIKNSIKFCSVHENSKPYACMSYPVFAEPKNIYYMRLCPGVRTGDLYIVKEWVERNKGIDFYNGMHSIIKNQTIPFMGDFKHLLRLIRKKGMKKAKKLKHGIKIGQQKIIMEMFEIKI